MAACETKSFTRTDSEDSSDGKLKVPLCSPKREACGQIMGKTDDKTSTPETKNLKKKMNLRSKKNQLSRDFQEDVSQFGDGDFYTEHKGSFTEIALGLKPLRHRPVCNDTSSIQSLLQAKPYGSNRDDKKMSSGKMSEQTSDPSDLCDSTLGRTLANSLKLISTNDLPEPSSPMVVSRPPSTASSPSQRYLEIQQVPSSTGAFEGNEPTCENVSDLKIAESKDDTKPSKKSLSPQPVQTKKKGRGRPRKRNVPESKEKNIKSEAEPTPEIDECVTLFQCEVCYKVFNRRQTLRQHFMTHTDRFACSFCKMRCKSKGDLRTHIQTHTKEKPYHCEVCNTDYTRESILKKHLNTQLHHKALLAKRKLRGVNNQTCRELTITEKFLMIGALSCRTCAKVFLHKKDLRAHSRAHCLRYKCTTCNKRCKTASLLAIHLKCHEKYNSLTCDICSRSFYNYFLLKEHKKSHKKSPAIEKQKAKVLKAVLKKHNKKIDEAQSNKNRWHCTLCSKSYANEKNLENHMKVHERRLSCDEKSSSMSRPDPHQETHERKTVCHTCDQTFSDAKELEHHSQSEHPSSSQHKCKICYQAFGCQKDLDGHLENHAPTMLFSGGSLDESSIPTSSKSKKPSQMLPFQQEKHSMDAEFSSDDECPFVVKKRSPCVETDDESLLDNDEFYSLLSSALNKLKEDGGENEDSDEELFCHIQSVLTSDCLESSDESDEELQSSTLTDSFIYDQASIEQKNAQEFALYKEENLVDKTFECKACGLFFVDCQELQSHMISHVCEFCNIFFADKTDLNDHTEKHRKAVLKGIKNESMRLKHKMKNPGFITRKSDSEDDDESDGFLSELESVLNCKVGNPQLLLQPLSHEEIVRTNKRNFERYSCIDTSTNIFACTICKRKYARPTTLTRHLKTHVCPYCNQFFEDKMDLLDHKHRHRKAAASFKAEESFSSDKDKILASPLINKVNRDLLKKFALVDKQNNIFRCSLCCKNFVRRTVLTRHMKTHICNVCDKFFEDKYDLAKHHNSHRVKCKLTRRDLAEFEACVEKSLASPMEDEGKLVSLTASMSNMAHFSNPYPVQGSGDNQTLTFIQLAEAPDSSTPQMFTATAPGGSTFQIISEPDTNPASFLVTSSGPPAGLGQESLYQCGDCGKRFFKEDHLKDHLVVHSKAKPYVCPLCGKSFARASALSKHEKTHLKRCKICDTAFPYKYELDMHMEMHRTYAF